MQLIGMAISIGVVWTLNTRNAHVLAVKSTKLDRSIMFITKWFQLLTRLFLPTGISHHWGFEDFQLLQDFAIGMDTYWSSIRNMFMHMHIRTLTSALSLIYVSDCMCLCVCVSVRQVGLKAICIQRRSSCLPKRGRSWCCGKKTGFMIKVQIWKRGGMVIIFMPVRELVTNVLVMPNYVLFSHFDWLFTYSPVAWRELWVNRRRPVYFEPCRHHAWQLTMSLGIGTKQFDLCVGIMDFHAFKCNQYHMCTVVGVRWVR